MSIDPTRDPHARIVVKPLPSQVAAAKAKAAEGAEAAGGVGTARVGAKTAGDPEVAGGFGTAGIGVGLARRRLAALGRLAGLALPRLAWSRPARRALSPCPLRPRASHPRALRPTTPSCGLPTRTTTATTPILTARLRRSLSSKRIPGPKVLNDSLSAAYRPIWGPFLLGVFFFCCHFRAVTYAYRLKKCMSASFAPICIGLQGAAGSNLCKADAFMQLTCAYRFKSSNAVHLGSICTAAVP